MKHVLSSLCGALATLISLSAHAAPTLYDNFTNSKLQSSKWNELETDRYVDSTGRLALSKTILGGTSSSSGTTNDNFGLSATDSAVAKSLAATITVTALPALQSCTANTTPSSARARVLGAFFNVRSGGPVTGDQTGDVQAQIYIRRYSNATDAAGVLLVGANVIQCTVADCSSSSTIASGSLGTTSIGTAETLQIDWVASSNQFKFTRGSATPLVLSYGSLDDSKKPGKLLNTVGLRNEAANCAGTSGSTRVKAGISALFDNVGISH